MEAKPDPPKVDVSAVGVVDSLTGASRLAGSSAAVVGAGEVAAVAMSASEIADPWEYKGLLNGRPVRVLLDSGAAASFLSA